MGDDPLSRLADIDLPGPPDWQPVLTALGAAVVLAPAMVWVTWHLWRRVPRRGAAPAAERAAARLDALRRRWEGGEIDDREASYRLAALLRLGLGMDQLDGHCPPALTADRTQWAKTVAALGRLRYEPSPAARLQAEDFARIKTWVTAAGAPAQPGADRRP